MIFMPRSNKVTKNMKRWKVYLNDQWIDTVFFNRDCDKDYVYRALVNHDGYDPRIVIFEQL